MQFVTLLINSSLVANCVSTYPFLLLGFIALTLFLNLKKIGYEIKIRGIALWKGKCWFSGR